MCLGKKSLLAILMSSKNINLLCFQAVLNYFRHCLYSKSVYLYTNNKNIRNAHKPGLSSLEFRFKVDLFQRNRCVFNSVGSKISLL